MAQLKFAQTYFAVNGGPEARAVVVPAGTVCEVVRVARDRNNGDLGDSRVVVRVSGYVLPTGIGPGEPPQPREVTFSMEFNDANGNPILVAV